MQFVDQTNLGPLKATQLYERIADRIAGEIRMGLLHPGERLPSERDLAQRLEVGRSSVREAIAALQVHGVIETRPGAGSFVAADAVERVQAAAGDGATASPHDASPSALLEARELLEPQSPRWPPATAAPIPTPRSCSRAWTAPPTTPTAPTGTSAIASSTARSRS